MDPSEANSRSPVLPSGLPEDWVFERDLECPKCRYNLRMLHLPRCPECGTVFRWQALLHVGCPRCGQSLRTFDGTECPRCRLPLNWERLLGDVDPSRFEQFEYTRRPRRAAFRAWFGALRPRRFWANIHLESPPVVRRLRWLRRTGLLLAIVGITAGFVPMWGWYGFYDPPWLSVLGIALILPVVTTLSLPRFTPTLARFRIRRDQLLRVSTYGTAGALWIGLLYMLGGLLAVLTNLALAVPRWQGLYIDLESFFEAVMSDSLTRWARGRQVDAAVSAGLGTLLFVVSFAWWWRFLYVALRYYLRLDARNALALLVSTQVIGLLILTWWFLEFTLPDSWELIHALGRLLVSSP